MRPRGGQAVDRLLLAVEVLSPSSGRGDRVVKRRLHQRAGTPEYWIVDPDARVVERWRPDDARPEILADMLTWHPEDASTPLILDIERLLLE
jgi:Uma2 family endonuclease